MRVSARILFVSHAADRTGPPMHLLALQRWLRAHTDVEVATALQRGGELRPELEALGEVIELRGDERPSEPYVDASGFDLVYCNASWTVRSLGAFSAPRSVVAHVHEMDDVIADALDAADRQVLLERPDLLLVGARSAGRNLVRHGADPERVVQVPYFLPEDPDPARHADPAARREELGLPSARPLVLGAGVVDWRKAPDLLLQVGWHLRRAGVHATVGWVGDRNERPMWCDLDDEAARLGIDDRVHLLPSRADLAQALAAADVFVLPSREDTFPLVALEAAALGVPIVCFDDAGIVELLEDDETGAVAGAAVPYPDLVAMAGVVAELLTDERRRAEVGEEARSRFHRRHRIEVAAPALLATIVPLLDRGR
jgi:glycosyltransferase involved in cell wall biosynthesis